MVSVIVQLCWYSASILTTNVWTLLLVLVIFCQIFTFCRHVWSLKISLSLLTLIVLVSPARHNMSSTFGGMYIKSSLKHICWCLIGFISEVNTMMHMKLIPLYQTCFEWVNVLHSDLWNFYSWVVKRQDLNNFLPKAVDFIMPEMWHLVYIWTGSCEEMIDISEAIVY